MPDPIAFISPQLCQVPGCSAVASLSYYEAPLCGAHLIVVAQRARREKLRLSVHCVAELLPRLAENQAI